MQDENDNNDWVGILLMVIVLWLILSVTFSDASADVSLSIDIKELLEKIEIDKTEGC